MAEKDEGEAGRSLDDDENDERGVRGGRQERRAQWLWLWWRGWTWLDRGDETAFPVT